MTLVLGSLVFKVGDLEHEEVEGFASGHGAAECRRQDLNPGSLVPYPLRWGRAAGQQASGAGLEPQDVEGGGAWRNSGPVPLSLQMRLVRTERPEVGEAP